ncbi:MAG: hypothetical protein MI741_07185, partial [Rhodospirillales bacterium]|nr:hypothetical protein [Rhodospirillales bacterium]
MQSNRTQLSMRFERGSATLAVVVAIVLLALLIAAYVQWARVQRQVPAVPPRNVEIILQSIINELKLQLKRDVWSEAGILLDQTPTVGIEPYDYPVTNTSVNRDVETLSGTLTGVSRGGRFDDTWLASSAPYFNGSVWRWRKVSTLTGAWYRSDVNPDIRQRLVDPTLSGSNPSGYYLNAYDNIPLTNLSLIDADGDGIGDSLFERAPIMLLDGIEYFFAMRVEDLSSRININTALGLSQNGIFHPTSVDNNPLTSDAPFGNNPSELDFALLCSLLTTPAPANEVSAQLQHRLGIALSGNTLLVRDFESFNDALRNVRHQYWREAGRYPARIGPPQPGDVGNDSGLTRRHYGLNDMFELLHKGGLNNDANTTPLEDDMSTALRRDDTGEALYTDTPYNTPALWFQQELRKLMTTHSGALQFKVPIAGTESFNTMEAKADLNEDTLVDIANEVGQVFTIGAPEFPAGFNTGTVAELASQFVANLRDFADEDAKLTEFNGRFFFFNDTATTEIYTQALY